MGKRIQGNSRKWSSSLAKLLQSKSHKTCQTSPQSGSMTLGLSPLQISQPVCSTHAMEVSISFQVSNFHQPILTFIHHFCRTTMGVFMPTCVCRWRGDEHILKMLFFISWRLKTSRKCSWGSTTATNDVDSTGSSEILYRQAAIFLELSQSRELLFFPEAGFSMID